MSDTPEGAAPQDTETQDEAPQDAAIATDSAGATEATDTAASTDAEAKPAPISLDPEPERRQARRAILRTNVQLFMPDNKLIEGRSIDISSGGIGLVSDFTLKAGLQVTVAFTMLGVDNKPKRYTVAATVANCVLSGEMGGFRLGLLFRNPGSDISKAISDYLARH